MPPCPSTAVAEARTTVVLVPMTQYDLQFNVKVVPGCPLGKTLARLVSVGSLSAGVTPWRLGRAGFMVTVLGSIFPGSSGVWEYSLIAKIPQGLGLSF